MANKATKRAETSDLISKLPDELLTHILSFVPSVTSVRTCILSKRWSRLWISVPNIDFIELSESVSEYKDFIERFFIMNRVMSVRTIQSDLVYVDEPEVSRFNAWIAAFSEREAEEVCLYFYVPDIDFFELWNSVHSLPDKFFIQNNLVKLKLRAVVLKVPHLVCFPKLKKMKLEFIQFFDDNSLKNLLFGSPVLGNLVIHIDGDDASNTLYICSSSLRDLRLDWEPVVKDYGYKIVIDTPNLADLWICDYNCSTYNVINLSSLVRAELHFIEKEACLELFTQITHVKELVLDDCSSGGFDYTTLVSMLIFNNLIHLEVNFKRDNLENLFHLFKCTPNLVTLTLNKPFLNNFACAWSEPHEVPRCFLSSIESVEFNGVEDSNQHMRMISYILKNAMVLKKLSLSCSPDRVTDNKFLLTLLTMPRSSAIATCQVDYTFE